MVLPKKLTNFKDVQRLILRVERDLLRQSQLRKMLEAAGVNLAGDREELRAARARLAGKPSARKRAAKRTPR